MQYALPLLLIGFNNREGKGNLESCLWGSQEFAHYKVLQDSPSAVNNQELKVRLKITRDCVRYYWRLLEITGDYWRLLEITGDTQDITRDY